MLLATHTVMSKTTKLILLDSLLQESEDY